MDAVWVFNDEFPTIVLFRVAEEECRKKIATDTERGAPDMANGIVCMCTED